MEDIKVGEYVSTSDGIKKVKSIYNEPYRDIVYLEGGGCFERYFADGEWRADYIEKHSFNVMDLIDIGDYVNGSKIIGFTYNDKLFNKGISKKENIVTEAGIIATGKVKTILTKWQYAENCYEVK